MSDSLQPHRQQHTRLPCPSLSPGVCSNSCPLRHPTISFSVAHFSSCSQSFPASGSFPVSRLFASGGQSIRASASILPVNIQGGFPFGFTGLISLLPKGLARVYSRTTVRSINSLVLSLLYVPILTSIHDYWKNDSFDYMDLCQWSGISAFNTLSGFIIAFLPRSRCLLISWLQSPCTVILEPRKIKSVTVSIVSQSICHEVMGPDAMILVLFFFLVSCNQLFHSPLSPYSRVSLVPLRFLPKGWCHLYIWGYWYFSWQSWIPACASSSLALLTMYSAYKLNKQGDNV